MDTPFQMNDEENPWSVNNLDVYLFYCCPECNEKFDFLQNKSKDLFLEHALKQHNKAKDCLLLNDVKVKLTDIKNKSVRISLLKQSIKCETENAFEDFNLNKKHNEDITEFNSIEILNCSENDNNSISDSFDDVSVKCEPDVDYDIHGESMQTVLFQIKIRC